VDRSIERRNSRRFEIALPLCSLDRRQEPLRRWTLRKHWPGGMFIIAAKTPPVGIEVEVEFVLPALAWGHALPGFIVSVG
jgi:hypothetical protein